MQDSGDRRAVVAFLIMGLLAAAMAAFGYAPGVQRWGIKTIVPPQTFQQRPVRKTVAQILALPVPAGVLRNDRRFQAQRIPGSPEGTLVQVIGYTRLVAEEDDGDFHVQVTSRSDSKSSPCIIVEVPEPGFIRSVEGAGPDERQTAATLAFKASSTRAALEGMLGHKPGGGALLPRPPKQCWQGILFYDNAHVGLAPRGKLGMKAGTLWELHPAWLCENQPAQ